MSLLKSLVSEMAAAGATGAHAIASGGGHETTTDIRSNDKKKDGTLWTGGLVNGEKRNVLKRVINMPFKKRTRLESVSFLEGLGVDHGSTDFDASDVLSKIDAAQKREVQNDDTTAFGLEDDQGNLVKVYVQNDQAEEFEKTLAAMLAGELENDAEENTAPEIAEVLFKLKDKYDLVDVEWPGIDGDEEEEQEVVGDAGAAGGAGGPPAGGGDELGLDAGAEGGKGDELGLDDAEGGELDLDGEEDMTADDDAKSALQDVIDVMKADAEARLADAEARTAEARAKEAEYTGQAASARVRREEQVFDMEAAEKEEKNVKKTGEEQAKLARFQHTKAQDQEAALSMESVEEDDDDNDQEITLTELTNLILKNLRHQG